MYGLTYRRRPRRLNNATNPDLTAEDIVLIAALGCDLDPDNEKDAIDRTILDAMYEGDMDRFRSFTQVS